MVLGEADALQVLPMRHALSGRKLGEQMPDLPDEGGGAVVRAAATKGQERSCLVCTKSLVWPSLHFCGPACTEAWVRRHRDEEPVLTAPKGKA